jgi:ribosomal protein L11 methyltransferase
VPYRIDLATATDDLIARLIDLGALDAEVSHDGSLAAVMPDSVTPEQLASMPGIEQLAVSAATGRDDGSVWVINVRPVRVGLHTVKLVDAPAFGTGVHPTTALCLEAIKEIVSVALPNSLLDVGTGSGVLALAALMLGVPRATGIDVDLRALDVASENARVNELGDRLELIHGGPAAAAGRWPLVVANVLAAPLIEMAPELVRRVGHRGQLVLSGVASSMEREVERGYSRLGMRPAQVKSRSGWVALVLDASW